MKSPKYELVAYYFENRLWNKAMVRDAVGTWITAEEAAEILQEPEPPAAAGTLQDRIASLEADSEDQWLAMAEIELGGDIV